MEANGVSRKGLPGDSKMDKNLPRIYRERASFYHCEPELFTRPGVSFFPAESLKNTITLARIGKHLLIRHDPSVRMPVEDIRRLDVSRDEAVLDYLGLVNDFKDYVRREPYIYFYKLNPSPAEMKPPELEIRRIPWEEYPELFPFFSQCSREDVEEAGIYPEEPDPVIFCGVSKNTIVTYVSHRYLSEEIADMGILVHPLHRRKGLGRWMVELDTRWCLENGKIPLYRVRRDNAASVSLISGLGYTPLISVYRLSGSD